MWEAALHILFYLSVAYGCGSQCLLPILLCHPIFYVSGFLMPACEHSLFEVAA